MPRSVPDECFIDTLILVPVDVSGRRNRHPVDLGVPLPRLAGEPPRRLGNNLQSPNNCIHRLAIRDEGRKIHLRRELRDGVHILHNIAQRCVGFLEGINCVVQNVIAEQRLERPAVHHISGAMEHLVDVDLQAGVLEDPHGLVRIQFHQHIDIAVFPGLAARHGTEHRGMRHA